MQIESIKNSWNGLLIFGTLYCSDIFLWLSGFFMAKNLLEKVVNLNNYFNKELCRRIKIYSVNEIFKMVSCSSNIKIFETVSIIFHCIFNLYLSKIYYILFII